jgi:hypothetical protein
VFGDTNEVDIVEPAWFAAGAAGGGALAAWFAAINGARTLRRARLDSQAKSRPMLAAELRIPPYTRGIQSLVIKNFGPTIARNIRVSFDPEIPDPEPSKAATSVTTFLKRRYANPIPVLTPGMELDNLYYVGRPSDGVTFENTEPTPPQVTVTIVYEGPDGVSYEEAFHLDVSLLRQRTYVTSSTSPESQAKEALKTFKAIHRAIVDLVPESRHEPREGSYEVLREMFGEPDERPGKPDTEDG